MTETSTGQREVNVYPNGKQDRHIPGADCPCRPEVDHLDDGRVWWHGA